MSLPPSKPIPPVLAALARFGYVIRGLLYIAIGATSVATAIGYANPRHMRNFSRELAAWPMGYLLLAVVAVGFLGFGLELGIRVLMPSDQHRSDWHEIMRRIGLGLAALGQWALAAGCVGGIVRLHHYSGGPQSWAREVLSYRLGDWAMILTGLGIFIFGVVQCILSPQIRFQLQRDVQHVSRKGQRVLTWLARIGYITRGLIFGTLGFYLARGGWRRDPRGAHDLGGTLYEIGRGYYGRWLLISLGAGLIAYGLLMVILSRYRRIGRSFAGP